MKVVFFYLLAFVHIPGAIMAQPVADYIKLSQELLYAVKTNEPSNSYRDILAAADKKDLGAQLKTDQERKAFWLNIYNAFTQIELKQNPDSYKEKNKFFTKKFIFIAGKDISLDLIEHGILRKSKAKYALGYFNKFSASEFEKQFRVDKLDYRIHFALNCGAKSCPPIAFYKPEKIDQQLDLATKIYLKNNVEYNAAENTVTVPAILSWFRADFGNKKGIHQLLQQLSIIPLSSTPTLKWKKYDWDLSLDKYEE